MVAMLAFGGTYAYFTATASQTTGTATTALIKLSNNTATITAAKDNALPGETIFNSDISLTDASTRDTYVFAKLEVKFGGTAVAVSDTSKLTITPDADWTALDGQAGVYYLANPAATTDLTFTISVALADDLDEDYVQGTSTDDGMNYMNKTVTVTIDFVAAQQEGLEAAEAYAETTLGA